MSGRLRSKCVAALVLLFGLCLLAGCRGDQASRSGLAWFRPPSWFQRQDEPLPADEFQLKPVPRSEDASVPSAPARVPTPPPAPIPDAPGAGNDFYDVRRTAAEDAAAAKPSWSDRFRSLFGDGSPPDAPPETARRADASDASPLLHPVPPLTERPLSERR